MAQPLKKQQRKAKPLHRRTAFENRNTTTLRRRTAFENRKQNYISAHTVRHAMGNAAVTVSSDGSRTAAAMLEYALKQLVAVASVGLPCRRTLRDSHLEEAYEAMSNITFVSPPVTAKPIKKPSKEEGGSDEKPAEEET